MLLEGHAPVCVLAAHLRYATRQSVDHVQPVCAPLPVKSSPDWFHIPSDTLIAGLDQLAGIVSTLSRKDMRSRRLRLLTTHLTWLFREVMSKHDLYKLFVITITLEICDKKYIFHFKVSEVQNIFKTRCFYNKILFIVLRILFGIRISYIPYIIFQI